MFNLLKLSKSDWKNFNDAGWIFYGFVFFICLAGSLQQNDNWLVAFGWACAALVIGLVAMVAAVLIWSLPFIIFDGIGRLVETLGDRRSARRHSQKGPRPGVAQDDAAP